MKRRKRIRKEEGKKRRKNKKILQPGMLYLNLAIKIIHSSVDEEGRQFYVSLNMQEGITNEKG